MAINFDRFDEWERWIPSLSGERRKPDADVASMEIRFMTRAERKRFQRLSVSAAMETMSEAEHDKALRGILDSHIRNIENLTSNGTPITEGSVLLDVDDDTFVDEVVNAMVSRSTLEAGLAKKLLSPSGSKSLAPNHSTDGDVPAVTPLSPEATPAEATKKAS